MILPRVIHLTRYYIVVREVVLLREVSCCGVSLRAVKCFGVLREVDRHSVSLHVKLNDAVCRS